MSDEYITKADRQLQQAYEGPMSLSEYVDAAFESPSIAAHASRYLLAAIESMDTRTVIEEGEKRDRYRFFDDPHNHGEHAVLGNTAVLNAFVDDLRTIAANRGKGEKIIWFDGPRRPGNPNSNAVWSTASESTRKPTKVDATPLSGTSRVRTTAAG